MVRRSRVLAESSKSGYGTYYIAEIARERQAVKRAIRRSDRALGKAEEGLDRAERRFAAAKAKHGDDSKHKEYQSAAVQLDLAYWKRKRHLSEARHLRNRLTNLNNQMSFKSQR